MKWNNFQLVADGLQIAREVTYNSTLRHIEDDSRFSYDESSRLRSIDDLKKKVADNKTRRVFTTFTSFSDFIREYAIARLYASGKLIQSKHGSDQYRYWSEVMTYKGRIVLEFDIDKNSYTYKRILDMYGAKDLYSGEYLKYLERLIIRSFRVMNLNSIADELDKEKVVWVSDPCVVDRGGDVHHIGDNVLASPFCWSNHCREEKMSMHLTLPVYSTERHVITKHLITIMTMLATEDGWKYSGNEMIADMNMAKEQQNLRLPYMEKYGTKGALSLHDDRHFPFCITSYVEYPYTIPEVFHIKEYTLSPYTALFFNDNTIPSGTECAMSGDTSSWWDKIRHKAVLLPVSRWSSVLDHYNGVSLRSRTGEPTYELIPKSNREWYCPICDREHSTFKPSLYSIDSKVWITCMRKSQYSGKALLLEDNNQNRVYDTIDTSRVLPQFNHLVRPMYGVPNNIRREVYGGVGAKEMCRPFPQMSEWKTLLVCSEKGTGKTYQLGKFLENIGNDIPICIISFRISLGVEQMKRYKLVDLGFKHYQDDGWRDCKRIVVTVESLHHWKHLKENSLIIIDEYESMLSQLDADTHQDKRVSLYSFKEAMKYASHVIVLDAGLTWNVGGVILQDYGRHPSDIYVQWNKTPLSEISPKEYTVYDSKEKWMGMIAREPIGTKIDIRTGLHSTQIASQVQKMRSLDDDQVVVITGDSPLKREDVESTYDGNERGQLCVVNSVHGAGNSYDKRYFDVLYSYGDGITVGPLMLIQMEWRVRHHQRSDVHSYVRNSQQDYHTLSLKAYYEYMNQVYPMDISTLSQEECNWRFLYTKSDKLVLSLIRVRDSICKHYMREMYSLYQEHVHGYTVSYDYTNKLTTSLKNEWKVRIKDVSDELKEITTRYSMTTSIPEKIKLKERQNTLKNQLRQVKEDSKEALQQAKDELDIQSIPKIDIGIRWNDVLSIFSTCSSDSSWKLQNDEDKVRNIHTVYDRSSEQDNISPHIQDHTRKLLSEVYWYSKYILQRGYTLEWKHAERFFYDHWNRGNKNVIQMCSTMKTQWDAYQSRVKNLIEKGILPTQARSDAMPDGLHRDALIRYRLLVQLLQFCERTIEGDTMKWLFKCSVRNDDKFKDLMTQFDRRFNTNIMKNRECHKDLWKKLSHILSHHLCIVHQCTRHQRRINGEIVDVNIITFNSDDSLV